MVGSSNSFQSLHTTTGDSDVLQVPRANPCYNGQWLAISNWNPPEGAAELGQAVTDIGEVGCICLDVGTFLPVNRIGYFDLWHGKLGSDPAHWMTTGIFLTTGLCVGYQGNICNVRTIGLGNTFPPDETLRVVGLEEIETYISRIQNMVAQ